MIINKRILVYVGIVYAVLFLGILVFYFVNPFENECVMGNCVNGSGTYLYNSGMKYEGDWKNGRRHGKGTLTYPKIYTYTGEWNNNKMEGQGTIEHYFYKYTGEWKDGKKNGKGTIYSLGEKYEGQWVNNLRHGQGTLIYPGGFEWIGEWKNGRIISGKGTIVAHDLNDTRYEGQVKNSKFYGKILISYPDGSRFAGELIQGKRYVQGTILYPDGTKRNKTLKNDSYLFDGV